MPLILCLRRTRRRSGGRTGLGCQRIQVGLPHAGKTAEITIGSDTYRITVDDDSATTAARTGSHDIRRHKASRYLLRQAAAPRGS